MSPPVSQSSVPKLYVSLPSILPVENVSNVVVPTRVASPNVSTNVESWAKRFPFGPAVVCTELPEEDETLPLGREIAHERDADDVEIRLLKRMESHPIRNVETAIGDIEEAVLISLKAVHWFLGCSHRAGVATQIHDSVLVRKHS